MGLTRRKWAWIFLSPSLVIYTTFWVIPIIGSLALSFFRWKGYGEIKFIAISNFLRITQDARFWISLMNNLIYAVFSIPLGIGLALFTALLLDRRSKGYTVFRAFLFLPVILSWVVVSMLWASLLNPAFGIINMALEAIGANFLILNWLGDNRIIVFTITFISIWKGYAFSMVILLAGLQGIPVELKEAAYIDGATETQCILKVVLPLLKPVANIVIVLALIEGLRVFAPFYVLTGGNVTGAATVLTTYLYKSAFLYNEFGYSSALAIVLFVIVMIVSIGYLRIIGRTDNIEY